MIKLRKLLKEELLTEATRWMVGVEEPNGKVLATYGHWDGHPSYVGKLLKKHYNNTALVKQLIKIGKQGISSLGKKIGKKHDFDMPYAEKEKLGYTTFYGRDRGEKGNMHQKFRDRQDFGYEHDQSYGYVWSVKDKKWYVYDYQGKEKKI
tara:strand:- start:35 stop:484 length:450 start_codon:yes stop_codon:yes gene_type:complete